MRDLNSASASHRAHFSSDFVEGLIAKRREAAPAPLAQSEKIPAKVYGVMALTTVLTFATLTTGYELLFSHLLYA
jgi:hypothetical protein